MAFQTKCKLDIICQGFDTKQQIGAMRFQTKCKLDIICQTKIVVLFYGLYRVCKNNFFRKVKKV